MIPPRCREGDGGRGGSVSSPHIGINYEKGAYPGTRERQVRIAATNLIKYDRVINPCSLSNAATRASERKAKKQKLKEDTSLEKS